MIDDWHYVRRRDELDRIPHQFRTHFLAKTRSSRVYRRAWQARLAKWSFIGLNCLILRPCHARVEWEPLS